MSTEFHVEGEGHKFNSADDVSAIVGELLANPSVKTVRLSGNTFGIEAAKAVAAGLVQLKSLEVAQLGDIFTGRLASEIPEALEALLNALLQLPNLHSVDLSDNAFGPTAQDPLIHFLSTHLPLRHLYLQNNGLGPEAGSKIALALTVLAQRKKAANTENKLETIICGRNRLEDGSMESWAHALTELGTLKTVKMVQNGIRPKGIESLIRDGLSSCADLECIDLQDNTFTQRGAAQLAGAVCKWTNLVELGVSDCLLSARGGVSLCDALMQGSNKNLKILRLQYNEIETDGIKALAEAIRLSLPRLEQLELNGNKFSEEDDSIEAIKSIFAERSLGELDDLDDLEEVSEEEGSESEGITDSEEQEDDHAEMPQGTNVNQEADSLAERLNENVHV